MRMSLLSRAYGFALLSILAGALFALGLPAAARAAEPCPNATARNGVSAYLPDCRAYELVSTAETNENQVGGGFITPNGQNFVYGFGTNNAGPVSNEGGRWLATRSSSGWLSANLALAGVVKEPAVVGETVPEEEAPVDVSNDGSQALYFTNDALVPADTNGEEDLYLSGPEESYTWLTADAIRGAGASLDRGAEDMLSYAGRSSDFSHVIFEASRELLPGMPASPTGAELYEWDAGQLRVVGVLPDGSIPAGGAVPGDTQDGVGGIGFVENAISSDGSTVFFESPDPVVAEGTPRQLYARIDGERTVEVSAPAPGVSDPNGPQSATFMAAGADGSVVFFTSHGKLTANANTGAYDEGANLYEFELSSGRLTDLTVDTSDKAGAQVQGVLGTSKDGSEIYFTALGSLTPNAPAGEDEHPHLYRENTSTGEVTYIAALSGAEEGDWINQRGGGSHGALDAYVAPDGQHLLFWSKESLTGYDNVDVASGESDWEIYEYGAATDKLTCVSCDPSGAQPTASTYFGEAGRPLSNGAHNMTEDGSAVVFETANRLLPRATNGFTNVYEWEQGGSGSCKASATSCLYLISTGTSPGPNVSQGVSPDGTDVYFGTPDQLVSQDQSENVEIYDARVGGGFPQVPSSACSGTGCQGVPPAAPIFATPSSATFAGVGNFAPLAMPSSKSKPSSKSVKCKKGKKLSHGKCVKKAKRKKAKAKKSVYHRRTK